MEFTVETKGKYDVVDITDKIKKIAEKLENGFCHVFVKGATAAIIINENWDPNIGNDFLNSMNKLVPEGVWKHDEVDNNGAAHLKAAMLGPSETIPVTGHKLDLGQWQDIMLIDFDGPRKERKIVVKLVDEFRQ